MRTSDRANCSPRLPVRKKWKKEEKGEGGEYRLPGTRKHRFVLLEFSSVVSYTASIRMRRVRVS